jgi:hypothetical protein|tara:strand:+ start:722 stop:844 length:123 start_codon:yes stop_codon:yes gene_type:complete
MNIYLEDAVKIILAELIVDGIVDVVLTAGAVCPTTWHISE